MTARLNKAFKRAQGLPDVAQDEVAERVLAYVEKLEALRDTIRKSEARGGNDPLDMRQIKSSGRRWLERNR